MRSFLQNETLERIATPEIVSMLGAGPATSYAKN